MSKETNQGLSELMDKLFITEDERTKLLSSSIDKKITPVAFQNIARTLLSGCFVVSQNNKEDICVQPTCVEIYYHEESSSIKDYIVYHKSSGKNNYGVCNPGLLHNHVSGIDITFEKEDDKLGIIRASALIRGFKIIGDIDNPFNIDVDDEDRSTYIYAALFSQFDIFSGFSIKWKDKEYDEKNDLVMKVRHNVSAYDSTGKKRLAMDQKEGEELTHDKKYVQDPRLWQFSFKS